MAIGFLGLMTEGILTSIGFRSLDGNDRLKRVWVHLAWQATAVSFVTAGFWVIYANKASFCRLLALDYLFCSSRVILSNRNMAVRSVRLKVRQHPR